MADGGTERRVALALPRHAGRQTAGSRRGDARTGRPDGLRPGVPSGTLRRHAQARRTGATAGLWARYAADGRTVRRAGCAVEAADAGTTAAHLVGAPADRGVCHA